MPLTDAVIRNARPKDAPYRLTDGAGMYLLVQPNGSRLWRVDFRLNGKRRTIALGAYPLFGLADARRKRDEARRLVAEGIDPVAHRQLAEVKRAASAAVTFRSVAQEYIDRAKARGFADRTIKKKEWLLLDLASDIAARPVAEITPIEILHLLQRYEKRGLLETANRLRVNLSAVFRLAVATLRAETDPTMALRGAIPPPATVSHAAITTEAEFAGLLRAIDDFDGWPTLQALMQFLALTGCRPGEARLSEWSEFDLEKAKWSVPPGRMKMRKAHEVPLSRQAVEVLLKAREISHNERYVFCAIRGRNRPLSDNAVNSALRRMGFSKTEHTAHGFRSSFSTILNERGHDFEIIERALAHQDGSVRGIYNRSRYWQDRVELMQAWADLLDKMKNPDT